jgi:hypothetical protein
MAKVAADCRAEKIGGSVCQVHAAAPILSVDQPIALE